MQSKNHRNNRSCESDRIRISAAAPNHVPRFSEKELELPCLQCFSGVPTPIQHNAIHQQGFMRKFSYGLGKIPMIGLLNEGVSQLTPLFGQ